MPHRWTRSNAVTSGAPVSWKNPDSGRYGTVVPGPAYVESGRNCRSYTHTIYIDGQPQTARGTACRNPDGSWTALELSAAKFGPAAGKRRYFKPLPGPLILLNTATMACCKKACAEAESGL